MTVQCSVFIASSLDGYIARPDGSLDWLEAANEQVPAGEDCGYAAFMADIDLLVMGSETFAKVLSFPEWPYPGRAVWVVSRTPREWPAGLPEGVTLLGLEPAALVQEAGKRGFRRLYVDGGRLIQSFLRAGLVSDITVTRIPVLLGTGRPLFGELDADIGLELLSSTAYPFGFVQTTYRVADSQP